MDGSGEDVTVKELSHRDGTVEEKTLEASLRLLAH